MTTSLETNCYNYNQSYLLITSSMLNSNLALPPIEPIVITVPNNAQNSLVNIRCCCLNMAKIGAVQQPV